MDIDNIMLDLNRRFSFPLPEFYTRRIIFWYDEEGEFEDQIDKLELDHAKVIKLTGRNTFTVKKQMVMDDTMSNYLVYSPLPFEKEGDNWLLNIQLYSEEFRADLNSIWMDEMGLPTTPVIRKQVKAYGKFFKHKDRRAKVKAMAGNITTAGQMHLAVMAALCGVKDMHPAGIIKAVLQKGLDLETNSYYQNFVNYGAQNAFWAMIAKVTGYNEGEDANLGRLAIHMLLTASTRTMHLEYLAGLDNFISTPHQAFCYDLISDWLHSDDNGQLYQIARHAEEEARLFARFSQLSVEDLRETECFPCINECILSSLMTEIKDQIIQVDTIAATVEKRRTLAWYDSVSCYYEGVLQVANMQKFFLEHSAGFHTVEPQKIWKEYTTDYYRMDTFYRQFQLSFQRSLKQSNPLLDDLFKYVVEKVEGLYSHWFLGQLGENWTDACADELSEYGRILEVPQQEDFYRSKVKNSDNKVYVIISDALRYEVAASLTEQLQRETQCKVKLNSCEAVFPTITKFGMAALLPHEKLDVVEKTSGELGILADGESTDAGYRDKILKKENKKSTALRYDKIIGMKRAERQDLVRGMDVVYIYHDKVDEASHTSDGMVFSACEDAITEIKNMVRIIVNEFGGTNIYITADHGFLYTYNPLREDEKIDKFSFMSRIVEYGRRFAILKKGEQPEHLVPVKFMDPDSEYEAYAPRENVRIKMNGSGLNFVHGGISLQEMVVPVVEYQFLRNSYVSYKRNKDKIDTKPVSLNLLSANRKISNMIFSLNFYQKEAVGGNREAATYLLYFVDAEGKQISDTGKIIADKTNENGQERTFRCSFNLRSQKYDSHASYFLVIADESGLQAPQKEEFQIDIAFAVDDFDFF
ncbi:MAG: BREX-1 system phosphatase PglZ type A [Lachnospiraceae bacterium]|nr:BREX-1 system phosphatase PglZ type A [Lachnospiraceae bacterium]